MISMRLFVRRAAFIAPAALVLGLVAPSPAAAQDLTQEARAVPRTPVDFTEIVRPLLPAVVNVSSPRPAGPGRRGTEMPRDLPPGLREFFERFFGPFGEMPEMPGPRPEAMGSGFIIDPSGYIVTNNHVVEGAGQVTVTLHDERELPAKLVGRDPRTDLALLKVESPQPLPYVRWGDSTGVEVGQWVIAVGNPFGLGGTVTAGIISALTRNIGAGPYDAFLQTDAAINRGNSGGPMFNTRGEVIGINTAIFSPTGGSIGIGFAVPSSLAQPIIRQLREAGKVERGWLGVSIQRVTPEIASGLGLPEAQGALVADVVKEGPAAKAGLRPGDVILAYRGTGLDDANRLPLMVANTPIDEPAKLTLWRDGERDTVDVTIGNLAEAPGLAALPAEPDAEERKREEGPYGLVLEDLTPSLRAQLEIDESIDGVVVSEVAPDGVAARQGLRAGDVIMQVNRQEVASPEELRRQLDAARQGERPNVLVLVRRGDANLFLTLPGEAG